MPVVDFMEVNDKTDKCVHILRIFLIRLDHTPCPSLRPASSAPPPALSRSYILSPVADVGLGQLCGEGLQVRLEGAPWAASDGRGQDLEAGAGGRLPQSGQDQPQEHFWADEGADQLRGPGTLWAQGH